MADMDVSEKTKISCWCRESKHFRGGTANMAEIFTKGVDLPGQYVIYLFFFW